MFAIEAEKSLETELLKFDSSWKMLDISNPHLQCNQTSYVEYLRGNLNFHGIYAYTTINSNNLLIWLYIGKAEGMTLSRRVFQHLEEAQNKKHALKYRLFFSQIDGYLQEHDLIMSFKYIPILNTTLIPGIEEYLITKHKPIFNNIRSSQREGDEGLARRIKETFDLIHRKD